MSRKYNDFSETEKKILAVVQKNLPDSLTPYADIAKAAGTTEEEVLNLLKSMKEDGSIRRFGASIKHQRAGFSYNAMVAWKVKDQNQAQRAAEAAVKHNLISHCYYRPSSAEDWPYEFFTMIHGRQPDEYLEVIKYLKENTDLDEYAVLESIKELKKISPTFFNN